MKYPFQKKSFWIIFATLLLLIFLFPPVVTDHGWTEWQMFFDIWYSNHIEVRKLIFETVIAFLLNYLAHLVFSKPK